MNITAKVTTMEPPTRGEGQPQKDVTSSEPTSIVHSSRAGCLINNYMLTKNYVRRVIE